MMIRQAVCLIALIITTSSYPKRYNMINIEDLDLNFIKDNIEDTSIETIKCKSTYINRYDMM